MAYELPDLPYDYTALELHISRNTLEFHHDKHHAGYANKFNAAVTFLSDLVNWDFATQNLSAA